MVNCGQSRCTDLTRAGVDAGAESAYLRDMAYRLLLALIALLTIIPALVGVAGTTLSTTVVVVLVPWMIAGGILAGLVFVVPLRGMHLRIVMEKRRLQTDVGGRIESTMGAIHERIDDGDAKAAGEFQNVMQVLVMERDLVDKLPTLPWRPGTAGAVVSAVVAPLALFVVTQLLEPLI